MPAARRCCLRSAISRSFGIRQHVTSSIVWVTRPRCHISRKWPGSSSNRPGCCRTSIRACSMTPIWPPCERFRFRKGRCWRAPRPASRSAGNRIMVRLIRSRRPGSRPSVWRANSVCRSRPGSLLESARLGGSVSRPCWRYEICTRPMGIFRKLSSRISVRSRARAWRTLPPRSLTSTSGPSRWRA